MNHKLQNCEQAGWAVIVRDLNGNPLVQSFSLTRQEAECKAATYKLVETMIAKVLLVFES